MPALSRDIEFIPDRLNEEPVVFLAMTNSELKYAVLVYLAICVPIAVLICAVFGKGVLGLALGPAWVFACLWLTGKQLRRMKRGKPKQYHILVLRAWLQRWGLAPNTFVRESRVWDIRRSHAR